MIISDYSMILFASANSSITFYAAVYTWKRSPSHSSYHFFYFIFRIFVEDSCKDPPSVAIGNDK